MPGTWIAMPTICSSRRIVAYLSCKQWADEGSFACSQWADQGSNQCSQWADEGSNQCASSFLNECHWYSPWNCIAGWLCQAWYWVANWVCQAWYWVAKWVCLAWFWIARWICLAWTWFVYIFCISGNGGAAFLLTDGSIFMNECASGYGTRRWWKLAPDGSGRYEGGTWIRMADSINGRKYFGTAVLADGRLVVAGGEYSDVSGGNAQDETNKCEIYDPVANSWAPMPAPGGLAQVGDAACCMLADGRLLIGDLNGTQTFTLGPATLTWTATGGAKSIRPSEESWVLMRDGTVVTPKCLSTPNAEKYDPVSDSWVSAGALAANIVESSSSEIGAGVLLTDGRAFFIGANAGKTALYTQGATPTAAGNWSAGPTIPNRGTQPQGGKDGPAALEPGGKVLFPAAPLDGVSGNYNSPCTFFEFDPVAGTLAASGDAPNSNCPTFVGRLLVLPSGDIFWAREDDSAFYLFRSSDVPDNAWRPAITSAPASIAAGASAAVSGTQFNGLSNASAYGDDYTAATNYPIVRLEGLRRKGVRYCRTANHSAGTLPSMGVATGATVVTTQVTVPGDVAPGAYNLVVVANGIPSPPVAVTIT